MNEIILCNRNLTGNSFNNECGIDIEDTFSLTCPDPDMIIANKPYLLKNGHPSLGATTLAKLSNPATSKNLTDLSLSFGGDNLIALSTISAKLNEFNVGLMGASTSVYAKRVGDFADAVKDYQKSLMEYRQAIMSKSPTKGAAKQKAKIAFDKMQSKFRLEVKAVTSQINSRRGTPMNNFKRGSNIARSSRSVAKLDLINPVHADNVVKFTKHAKFLGNGLAVVDFGSRVGNIHNSYKAGDNWQREMFIESTSFVASAATGIGVVNAGATALTFLVVATPVGWVGLIVGGLAVAGTAAAASITANNIVKEDAGGIYDFIMKQVDKL
ncbi:hypothetical protein [Pseudoalteromonas mariniglutinosa]|uniref:hypothetical protein n=1 Tax=Pseudoalteromonas mariniglutinosa TaxID=206042 RepID=UPI00384B1CEC